MPHKIALVGSAPSSDKLAPFALPDWEIWACSPGNHVAPRVDAWFEMHSLERKIVPGNEPYVACLKSHPRVYVSKEDQRLPNAIVYPINEVRQFFGGRRFFDTFLQSSVSYMLAMAIMQKPEIIGLWGIDMAADEEYAYQRPGCHYFFDEAQRRDIGIMGPPQSDILEPLPAYGYKEHDPSYWRQKARKIELKHGIEKAEQKIREAEQEALIKRGALADIKYTMQTWRMNHTYPLPPAKDSKDAE